MTGRTALLVLAGGGLGSLARLAVTLGVTRLLGPAFPWGTLVVNGVGSFAMGVAAAVVMARAGSAWVEDLRLVFMTGFLGGFTTFSAFSLELVALGQRGAWLEASLYAAGSVAFGVVALLAGLWLGRAVG